MNAHPFPKSSAVSGSQRSIAAINSESVMASSFGERLVCESFNHKSLGLAALIGLFACIHAKNFPVFCPAMPRKQFEE